MRNRTKHFIALLAFFSFSIAAFAETLVERIKPVGSVCMAGESCASAVAVASAGNAAPRSGEEVYNTKCASCHASGAAGAPKLGDVAAWAPRIAKGMDTLYLGANQGIGAMPAKGLCFDCSEGEINASVDYMVNASK